MDSNVLLQLARLAVLFLLGVAATRIYRGALGPALRNWRLARRGFSQQPAAAAPRERRGLRFATLIPIIAMIGILAAIGIPAYQNYVARARDHLRAMHLQQIQNALYFYYMDHKAFPILAEQNFDAAGFSAALASLVRRGYMPSIPNDPRGGSATYYYRSTSGGTFYCLGAVLEVAARPSSCDTNALGGPLSGANYAVGP